MEYYDFTLRFDDEDHSLTQRNGLPVEKLAELLLSLSKAVGTDEKNPLILSEIGGNCYAVQVTTPIFTIHETLKVVHGKISNNDFTGLNTEQKRYASKLRSVLGGKLTLTAYDNNKIFNVEVNEIILPKQPEYYYEVGSIYGQITSIGGTVVDGKTLIHVNKVGYDIEINSKQENELIQYYKKNKIRFLVQKKVTMDKNEILSAKLESYEVLGDRSFYDVADEIRKHLPDSFYAYLSNNIHEQE